MVGGSGSHRMGAGNGCLGVSNPELEGYSIILTATDSLPGNYRGRSLLDERQNFFKKLQEIQLLSEEPPRRHTVFTKLKPRELKRGKK